MKIDYSKLKQQIPKSTFDHFIDHFSNQPELKESIIQKVKEEGLYVEPLETGSSKVTKGIESIDYTALTFEKVSDEVIEVYIHKNSSIINN
ncbi:hypothetical protein GLW20_01670 [Virgibacillus halodenitrificans]|nr:hypothetical protein [Virgibacillus halodenitrificans]